MIGDAETLSAEFRRTDIRHDLRVCVLDLVWTHGRTGVRRLMQSQRVKGSSQARKIARGMHAPFHVVLTPVSDNADLLVRWGLGNSKLRDEAEDLSSRTDGLSPASVAHEALLWVIRVYELARRFDQLPPMKPNELLGAAQRLLTSSPYDREADGCTLS